MLILIVVTGCSLTSHCLYYDSISDIFLNIAFAHWSSSGRFVHISLVCHNKVTWDQPTQGCVSCLPARHRLEWDAPPSLQVFGLAKVLCTTIYMCSVSAGQCWRTWRLQVSCRAVSRRWWLPILGPLSRWSTLKQTLRIENCTFHSSPLAWATSWVAMCMTLAATWRASLRGVPCPAWSTSGPPGSCRRAWWWPLLKCSI